MLFHLIPAGMQAAAAVSAAAAPPQAPAAAPPPQNKEFNTASLCKYGYMIYVFINTYIKQSNRPKNWQINLLLVPYIVWRLWNNIDKLKHSFIFFYRFGQETVQDIVSRTQDVFQTLKAIQVSAVYWWWWWCSPATASPPGQLSLVWKYRASFRNYPKPARFG